jgi:hypothetical protein
MRLSFRLALDLMLHQSFSQATIQRVIYTLTAHQQVQYFSYSKPASMLVTDNQSFIDSQSISDL